MENPMSRRRAPRTPSAIPRQRLIRIVCTDKDQHPEVSFGSITVWPHGDGWRVNLRGLGHRQADEFVDMAAADRPDPPDRLPKTYTLKCRRCGRDRPLRMDTLERIGAAFADADTPRLDLSDL
jgi:hypothetical protein